MLWLLRHADAAPAEEGQSDAERPLTQKGREQARTVGAALAVLGVELDACLTSPRLRALDTARIACAQLGVDVHVAPELSGGDFDPERVAAGFGDEVLLVAHNPDVAHALHALTGARVRFRKGALAAVAGHELHAFLRPSDLRAIAAGR
jgi:phosphohistidine phosphatase